MVSLWEVPGRPVEQSVGDTSLQQSTPSPLNDPDTVIQPMDFPQGRLEKPYPRAVLLA